MSDTKVYEIGDTATYQGRTVQLADINFNVRNDCDCRDGCPRVQFDGGGYARTCQLAPTAPAEAPLTPDELTAVNEISMLIADVTPTETPAPISLAAQAGTHVIRFQILETGVYRVQAENSHGGLIQIDTRDGLTPLARSYASQHEARQVARDITILLRAGLSPRAVASLTLNTTAA